MRKKITGLQNLIQHQLLWNGEFESTFYFWQLHVCEKVNEMS